MESLESSQKFKQWKASLDSNKVSLNKVEELYSVRKGNGEILFSMIKADAEPESGPKLLPIALLRGNFVSIVTVLVDEKTEEEYFLLVRQRRIATGGDMYEHPAGMCDSETDPYEVAIHELSEETGVEVSREQLVMLKEELVYSSPGLLDEGGYYFCCTLRMTKAEIDSYHGRETGDGGENEFIHTYVARPDEAKSLILNVHGLLVCYLYDEWKAKA